MKYNLSAIMTRAGQYRKQGLDKSKALIIAWAEAKAALNTTIQAFEVGKYYECHSVCDSECKWTFQVVKRTDKSVWIKDDRNKISMKKISILDNSESIYPLGIFSMAPILRASRKSNVLQFKAS